MQTDSGTQFNSQEWKRTCAEHGLVHRTCPIDHQAMNGQVERAIGVLAEKTRALLMDKQTSKKYWPLALEAATYLLNRTPHESLGGVSPLRAFDEEASGLETDTHGIREPLRAVEELVEMGDPAPDVEDEPEAPHRTASTDESMEETDSYEHQNPGGKQLTSHTVAEYTTVRCLFALAAALGQPVLQADFPNAYLNADIGENMYTRQASGLEHKGKEGWVYKLKKALYGSPVSGHRWHSTLQEAIETLGYSRSTIDHCLFHRAKAGHRDLLVIYLDDVLVTSTGGEARSNAQLNELGAKFSIKKLGLATHMLGIGVHQGEDYTTLDQTAYLKMVLSEAKYVEAKLRGTTWDPHLREDEEPLDEKEAALYRKTVGKLMYLSTITRPDISFAVGRVASGMSTPTKGLWMRVKRILRYLRGTPTCHLGTGPVHWRSHLQSTVADSPNAAPLLLEDNDGARRLRQQEWGRKRPGISRSSTTFDEGFPLRQTVAIPVTSPRCDVRMPGYRDQENGPTPVPHNSESPTCRAMAHDSWPQSFDTTPSTILLGIVDQTKCLDQVLMYLSCVRSLGKDVCGLILRW
eukprot:19151_1